ncbi:hypothetical protein BpHYR1_023215 [Brachionus plicatilis]|uniref:Uncharacterized protein n=1 Tax=Brachionus plicatilis TaxID=10195 RepID=A0A3M7PNH9_BRAPC|nr:hypothetical protein BpHYR1_023215 [Brachionus plicatilis]
MFKLLKLRSFFILDMLDTFLRGVMGSLNSPKSLSKSAAVDEKRGCGFFGFGSLHAKSFSTISSVLLGFNFAFRLYAFKPIEGCEETDLKATFLPEFLVSFETEPNPFTNRSFNLAGIKKYSNKVKYTLLHFFKNFPHVQQNIIFIQFMKFQHRIVQF